jgi:hypothetical protein
MDKSMAVVTEGKAVNDREVMAQIKSERRLNEDRNGTMSILPWDFPCMIRDD